MEVLEALDQRTGPTAEKAQADFRRGGLPTRRNEAWKYSDLRAAARRVDTTILADWYKFFPIGPEADSLEQAPDSDIFAARWAAAMEPEATVYLVAAGETRDLEIEIDGHDGFGHATTIVRVAPGATCVARERYIGSATSLGNKVFRYEVGEGATLHRIVLQEKSEGAVIISTAFVDVAEGASFTQFTAAEGAGLARLETQVRHAGNGAFVRLDGLYLLSDSLHADLTSVVDHAGPNGQTSQLTKGVVRDTARGVFQGKIVVERGADGTDARMGHHALILGERAEVDAKPELVIYADDVQCAHGNTVGNLDESALFYMQQRGIPVDEARALLTQAFLIEVVDRIEHDGAREVVRSWLTERL
ncbi:MAG: Fe-S cluster assembly protein SufD [Brevundimonas sp.]|nr:Fe-S cluster assembly protein SufD [Brevundimonas sp.]